MARSTKKIVNAFKTAPVFKIQRGKRKKAVKDVEYIDTKDLDNLAVINTLSKLLDRAKVLYYSSVKDQGLEQFTAKTIALAGRKPANYKGRGEVADAWIQLRKRSSPLSDEEVTILEQLHIRTDIDRTVVPECFFLDDQLTEVLMRDEKTAMAISRVLESSPSVQRILEGRPAVCRQEQYVEETHFINEEHAFEDLAKLSEPVMVRTALRVINIIAITCKMQVMGTDVIMGHLAQILKALEHKPVKAEKEESI